MNKLIKTADDHANAITRLSGLMDRDPAPGSPEAEELELLAHLIESYEKVHHDIGLPDPISAIHFRMEQGGLARRDLVPFLGSASRVSEVLTGKRPLTLGMVRALHQGLGIPAEVLLQEPGREDVPTELPVAKFPLKEMFKRGWLPDFHGTWREAQEQGEELLRRFFCFGTESGAILALNRQMKRAEARKDDAPALLAWKTHVLCRAVSKELDTAFDREAVTPDFLRHLTSLSRHKAGPTLAVEWLESYGVRVVIEPRLDGTLLDGAALRLPGTGQPVVGLTLRHDRVDNFWFCLLHELAHVTLHLATDQAEGFLDNLDLDGTKDALEAEADRFALDALVPEPAWRRIWEAKQFDPVSVQTEARQMGIHGAILAGRIRQESKDYRLLSRVVTQSKVRHLFPDDVGAIAK